MLLPIPIAKRDSYSGKKFRFLVRLAAAWLAISSVMETHIPTHDTNTWSVRGERLMQDVAKHAIVRSAMLDTPNEAGPMAIPVLRIMLNPPDESAKSKSSTDHINKDASCALEILAKEWHDLYGRRPIGVIRNAVQGNLRQFSPSKLHAM